MLPSPFTSPAPLNLAGNTGPISGSTITATTKFVMPNGTANAPGLTSTSDATTGLWRRAAGQFGIAVGGADMFGFSANATLLALSDSATIQMGAGLDLSFGRDAANVFSVKAATAAQTIRVYGTTTGPKYLSLSHDGTNGIIDTAASSGLLSIAPTSATSVAVGKPFTQIGGTTTVGAMGVPGIVATGRVTAQSAANASISTFTNGAADASYEVSGNMNVTASTTLSTSLFVTYTDESNVSRTMIFPVNNLSGTLVAAGAITGAGASVWSTPVMHIRCKASTAITIGTSAGTFTGITYTAEGIIKRTA